MHSNTPAALLELHVARSQFIDAYNVADRSVRRRLKSFGIPAKSTMKENLSSLAAIPPNPQYSKDAKKRVESLINELAELRQVRCDVVHGQMTMVADNLVPAAMFSNVQNDQNDVRSGSLMTITQMNAIAVRLADISTQIAPSAQTTSDNSNVVGIMG